MLLPRRPRLRRVLLALAPLAICLAAWAFWFEPRRITVHVEHLAVEHLPPLRLAVLSDLHAGGWHIDDAQLAEIVRETNAQKPDLVLIAGDFVEPSAGVPMSDEAIAQALSKLEARYGVVGVLGNHDRVHDARHLQETLESKGISLLVNDAKVYADGAFAVAGLDDEWSGRPDPARALAKVPDGMPVLMLMHNPDAFPRLSKRISLTIAGHTHGGQVRFPVYGAPIVPSKFKQRYVGGTIREDGRTMFVTTGLGTSILPVRFGVPPEIAVLDVSP